MSETEFWKIEVPGQWRRLMRFTRHTHRILHHKDNWIWKEPVSPGLLNALFSPWNAVEKRCTGFSRPPDRCWAGQKSGRQPRAPGPSTREAGRTGAGGGRPFPQRAPAGRMAGAGRRGRTEARTRVGRGLEGSAGSRWRHGWGRVVCRYLSAGAAGPWSGA